jgi:hypothetical protein
MPMLGDIVGIPFTYRDPVRREELAQLNLELQEVAVKLSQQKYEMNRLCCGLLHLGGSLFELASRDALPHPTLDEDLRSCTLQLVQGHTRFLELEESLHTLDEQMKLLRQRRNKVFFGPWLENFRISS